MTAACTTMQTKLGRPLLWAACTKHIGETLLRQIWNDLNVETSRSSEIGIFKRFRDSGFAATPKDQPLHTCTADGEFLNKQLQHMKTVISDLRREGVYPRGDYKELLDLIDVHLGNATSYRFQRPGAVHKARWMGKQLYCYKLILLQEYLPRGIATKDQIKKMERIVQFCTFVLNDWWLNCSVATSAPRQDLTLLQNIKNYKEIDECLAKSAEKAFLRHTWYMVGEMVPLALWDEDLVVEQKQGLADAIMSIPECNSFENRVGRAWGKPNLSAVDTTKQNLGEYVTADSRMFFTTLKLPTKFLQKPVEDWKDDPSYQQGATILNSFMVTNEGAERAVKLVADFLGLSKSEDKFQSYLQVVETHRKETPNLRQPSKRRKR